MPLQPGEEFSLCLVSAFLRQQITGNKHEPWAFKLDEADQIIPFANHLVQIAGEDHFHRIELLQRMPLPVDMEGSDCTRRPEDIEFPGVAQVITDGFSIPTRGSESEDCIRPAKY